MNFDTALEPHIHFGQLLAGAQAKGVPEATAMSLSTVGPDLKPSTRIVYCKEFSAEGFIFYTNYGGAKSQAIESNPEVCLNFFWPELWQQVRINGRAEKVTRAKSEEYFATRERLSQLGAWASDQSEVLPNKAAFEEKLQKVTERFEGKPVPCPPNWGGFLVRPTRIEFWFGAEGRLHERYVYEQEGPRWKTYMLNP